jgi:hypothetical protein
MSRRKKIHGHRRRKSSFRKDDPIDKSIIDCDDRLDYLKNRKYCDNLEYQRRKNRYEGKDYKTDDEIAASNKNVTLDKTADFKTSVVTGTPPVVGPRTLKFMAELSKRIDLEGQLSEAYKQWTSGFTHSGRGK